LNLLVEAEKRGERVAGPPSRLAMGGAWVLTARARARVRRSSLRYSLAKCGVDLLATSLPAKARLHTEARYKGTDKARFSRGTVPPCHSPPEASSQQGTGTRSSTSTCTKIRSRSKTMTTVQIYFDGGAAPNPGKGYGSFEVFVDWVSQHKASRVQFGDGLTNNQAEYMALLAALHWCVNGIPSDLVSVRMFTDSEMLQRQLSAICKCRKPHLMELLFETQTLLKRYSHWQIEWRPRACNVAHFGH
jgi:ribonuclease HI